jgi:hypothetical protein
MKNHINPLIVDSITGLNSFNAAVEGSSAAENTMILKAYLLHNKAPEFIFLSADIRLICNDKILTVPISYFTCDDILPINQELKKCGLPMNLYHAIPFLKLTEMTDYYRLSFLYRMSAIIFRQGKVIEYDQKGFANTYAAYMDSTKKRKQPLKETKESFSEIKPQYVAALDELISICKQNHIQLVFVYTPEYKHYYTNHITNTAEIVNVYSTMAINNNIPFLRHDSIEMCNNAKFFRNDSHLNAVGAALYSHIFAQDILQKGIIHRP